MSDTATRTRVRWRRSASAKIVLGINVFMFLVKIVAGWCAGSTALIADSLDMLRDAFAYGFSLYVVGRSLVLAALMATSGGMDSPFLLPLFQRVFRHP